MTYPRFPHGQDGDDVSQQELVVRDDVLDDAVKQAEDATAGHLADPQAHPEVTRPLADRLTAVEGTVSSLTRRVNVPRPPATGNYRLEAKDGALVWVPF